MMELPPVDANITFTPNFVTELVKFVSEVIGNYEVTEGRDKYKEEADSLSQIIIELLRSYLKYYRELKENLRNLKK
jgi:hypothetical protein